MGLFAPHGWASIGHAAAILMLSFVGWEATAPLTPRLRDPARQLPRVIAIALATTTALYLGLAVTTIAVLGHGAGTDVPLADLLRYAIGPAGRAAAAVAAVVLTLGATNAYLTGASAMAVDLTRHPGQQRHRRPARPFLALIAAAGLLIIGLYSLRLVTTTQLVTLPTTLFLAVYLGCTISAARTLAGRARYAAMPALAAVIVVLLFSGWALAITAAVAATAALAAPSRAERNPTAMPRRKYRKFSLRHPVRTRIRSKRLAAVQPHPLIDPQQHASQPDQGAPSRGLPPPARSQRQAAPVCAGSGPRRVARRRARQWQQPAELPARDVLTFGVHWNHERARRHSCSATSAPQAGRARQSRTGCSRPLADCSAVQMSSGVNGS